MPVRLPHVPAPLPAQADRPCLQHLPYQPGTRASGNSQAGDPLVISPQGPTSFCWDGSLSHCAHYRREPKGSPPCVRGRHARCSDHIPSQGVG